METDVVFAYFLGTVHWLENENERNEISVNLMGIGMGTAEEIHGRRGTAVILRLPPVFSLFCSVLLLTCIKFWGREVIFPHVPCHVVLMI